jgi:hypothetical protein
MSEEYVWQHYVPASYLKRFSGPKGRIHVFDKVTKEPRIDRISEIAAAKHFYTYPETAFPEDIREGVDRKVVEKAFQAIESRFSSVVDALISNANNGKLPKELHEAAVTHLILQLIRTPVYRTAVKQMQLRKMEQRVYEDLERRFPEADKELYPRLENPEHNTLLLHNALMFERRFLHMHLDVLMNYIWLIAISPTRDAFYTSDIAVSKTIIDKTGELFGGNLWATGIEYALPLSPRHTLLLLERTYFGTTFPDTLINEGTAIETNNQITGRLNQAQTANCFRCVFSSTGDFSDALEICRERPEICVVDRERIRPPNVPNSRFV